MKKYLNSTEEELNFLKRLGSELITQEHKGTKEPLLYRIMYDKIIYGVDNFHYYDGECLLLYRGGESFHFITPEEVKGYIWTWYGYDSEVPITFDDIMKYHEVEIDYNNLDLTTCKKLLEFLGEEVFVTYYVIETGYLDTSFLTYKSALEYLKRVESQYRNASIYIKHDDDPILEQLLDIVKNISFRL